MSSVFAFCVQNQGTEPRALLVRRTVLWKKKNAGRAKIN